MPGSWKDYKNNWVEWNDTDKNATVKYFIDHTLEPITDTIPSGIEEEKERACCYQEILKKAFIKLKLNASTVTSSELAELSKKDDSILAAEFSPEPINEIKNYIKIAENYLTHVKIPLTSKKVATSSTPPQPVKEFLGKWNELLSTLPLKDKFIPIFTNEKDVNEGFRIKQKDAATGEPAAETLITFTPQKKHALMAAEKNWPVGTTDEDKITLLIAGFEANNTSKKEFLKITGGSEMLRKILREQLRGKGYKIEPEPTKDLFRNIVSRPIPSAPPAPSSPSFGAR